MHVHQVTYMHASSRIPPSITTPCTIQPGLCNTHLQSHAFILPKMRRVAIDYGCVQRHHKPGRHHAVNPLQIPLQPLPLSAASVEGRVAGDEDEVDEADADRVEEGGGGAGGLVGGGEAGGVRNKLLPV